MAEKKTKVELAHHFTFDGKDHLPGDVISVDPDEATRIVNSGYGRLVSDESAKPAK